METSAGRLPDKVSSALGYYVFNAIAGLFSGEALRLAHRPYEGHFQEGARKDNEIEKCYNCLMYNLFLLIILASERRRAYEKGSKTADGVSWEAPVDPV